ncbi:hypothetical protein PRIPAC_72899 [Pristionchus pacificus]|uniref:Uncharacterized protein n=1 Tax=Pristionchus pacificus TaxID=54126 RepID=A0A454XL48_PRIPA|nr:hypothetical protein PRIPAC_72899 [Pristionchus pacificus]|eukprot:PDM75042.1 hypothetical protein PRIPAC_40423 [Pristionchus pacificus]
MLIPLLSLALPLAFAQFGPPSQGQLPPLFPPHIEDLIPADVLAKMKAVHENPSLPPQMKHEQIDDLMISLPTEILDKIPPPPGFDQLPKDVQETIKKLSRNRSVKWSDRQASIRRFIDALPENVKALIPMPGAGGPPGFEAIPIQQRAEIQMIENDQNMSFRDRYFKIKQIMDSLPVEIRSQLPAVPPPPPY